MRNEKGFTFLEILLVVTLVITVFTLTLLTFNPYERKAQARDNKRLSDMALLDRAVNEYLLDNGDYPDVVDTLRDSTTLPVGSTSLDNVVAGWILADLSAYSSRLPLDPLNDATYRYYYYHDTTSYELNAVLENLLEYSQNDGGNDPDRYEMGNNKSLITP